MKNWTSSDKFTTILTLFWFVHHFLNYRPLLLISSLCFPQTEFGKEEFYEYNHPLVPAIKCVYYPQIGFLIAVPILKDHTVDEQIELSDIGLDYQVQPPPSPIPSSHFY